MKKLATTLLVSSLMTATNFANARDTLIDLDDASVGGFGGPIFKYSRVLGQDSLEIGGAGGATFTSGKQSIMIGGGGFGLANEFEEDVDFGYAGLILGYTYDPQNIIHVDNRLLIGAGGIKEKIANEDKSGSFLIAELSTQIDVNVTKFFEIGIGGSYRMISAPSRVSIANKDINGSGIFIALQFGSL